MRHARHLIALPALAGAVLYGIVEWIALLRASAKFRDRERLVR